MNGSIRSAGGRRSDPARTLLVQARPLADIWACETLGRSLFVSWIGSACAMIPGKVYRALGEKYGADYDFDASEDRQRRAGSGTVERGVSGRYAAGKSPLSRRLHDYVRALRKEGRL